MNRATARSAVFGNRSAAIRPILAFLAMLAAVAAVTSSVVAQEAASPTPQLATSITVQFEPSSVKGIPHYLAARLVAEDGSAVVGERVQVRRAVDAFGGRIVTIGRANTDNAGIARVPLEPREEVYAVSASFAGSDSLAPSSVEDDVVFPAETVIVPEDAPQGGLVDPQLRPLADVMPLAIGGAVILIWVVLLGLTAFTLLGIHSSSRSEGSASGQAKAEAPGAGPAPRHR